MIFSIRLIAVILMLAALTVGALLVEGNNSNTDIEYLPLTGDNRISYQPRNSDRASHRKSSTQSGNMQPQNKIQKAHSRMCLTIHFLSLVLWQSWMTRLFLPGHLSIDQRSRIEKWLEDVDVAETWHKTNENNEKPRNIQHENHGTPSNLPKRQSKSK